MKLLNLFNIFFFIHLVSLITGFGAVLVIDFLGIAWIRGKVTTELLQKFADHTQKIIWLGYSGLILSGLVLISQKGFIDNLMQIKIFFVIMIGANGIFLHTIKKKLQKLGNVELPFFMKFRITVASMISQVGWWGALSIGFVHNNWRHEIWWPNSPWMFMVAIGAGFLVILSVGNLLLKEKQN